jgi:chemotaxis signal transduction protein
VNAAARGGEADAAVDASLAAVDASLAAAAGPDGEAPSGVPFLRAHVGGMEWLVPLAGLRTVLAELPRVVPLPHAPEWLLGVFPYRAELLALADPAPVLTSLSVADTTGPGHKPTTSGGASLGRCALIAGTGERSLAWQLERVGDVIHLPESAVLSARSGAALAPSGWQRFCVGIAALEEAPGTRLPVLDVDGLLAALLDGLAEEDRGE